MKTQSLSRLEGLDLARCLALVGMVLVNFRLAMGVESGQPTWLAQAFEALQGRSAATFVVLAGMGFTMGTRHLEYSEAVKQTIRRSIFLLTLGMLNCMVFPADIIHYYGIYFLVGAALLSVGSRSLLFCGLSIILGFPLLSLLIDYSSGWNWTSLEYLDFWTINGFVRHLIFNGWHPVLPWVAFLLWGMFLARTALQTTRVQVAMIVGGATCAAIAHGLSTLGITLWPSYKDFMGVTPLPPMPLYIFASAGIATALTGLCIVIMQRWGQFASLRVLLPAGRMTLTLYIAHILLGMGTLEAMGWLQGQGLVQVAAAAATYCILAIVFAWVWAKFFQQGPLEWLMRRLTR